MDSLSILKMAINETVFTFTGITLVCKLWKLPVKLDELEETDVGKTINSLRKCNGSIAKEATWIMRESCHIFQFATPMLQLEIRFTLGLNTAKKTYLTKKKKKAKSTSAYVYLSQ